MQHIDWPTAAVYMSAVLGPSAAMVFAIWLISRDRRQK